MKFRVLGPILLVLAAPSPGRAQDCSSGPPVRLIRTINPVVGQSPAWVTLGPETGKEPVLWEGSNHPVQALWIRDLAVRGPAFLTGILRGGKAKARFATGLYGLPVDRFKFDLLGEKLQNVREDDLKRYSFHRTYVWFPEPGCYEMTVRVGSQPSLIVLAVAAGAPKPSQSTLAVPFVFSARTHQE